MITGFEDIDWPSWISAICAAIAIIISLLTAMKSKKYYSEYALVSRDGNVISHKGFKEYGLNVKLASVPISDDRANEFVPEYIIEFAKVPSYFEVTTKEGAVVILTQESPLVFNLRFVSAGFGAPTVDSNFKIQAY